MGEQQESIKTFAILDLEVNNLPKHQFNQCSLTELCIYGVSAKYFQNDILKNGRVVTCAPVLPRSTNRINIMINPMRRIHDNTTTGLDNYMLEYESPFDENTADCILKFINRLEKPVCLVAHNGFDHDFRLIRHVYEKINVEFPSDIYCVDSLLAFRKIDLEIFGWNKANYYGVGSDPTNAKNESISNQTTDVPPTNEQVENSNSNAATNSSINLSDKLSTVEGQIVEDKTDEEKNWQVVNESTPKNKSTTLGDDREQLNQPSCSTRPVLSDNVKRKLFSTTAPENNPSYTLGKLYNSVFSAENCRDLHQAEGDVKILTKLVLHYGKAFIEFAEHNKIKFNEVPKLGAPNYKNL